MKALIIIMTTLLGGCSTGVAYESVRQSARSQCYTLPESDRAACLNRYTDDYDTYTRKRQDIIDGKE